jgi:ASC-1-like (ASCH) protein
MKKLIFILFFVPFNFSAQDVQNRILLIKEMYKETNRLMDKENVICKKIKAIEYDDDEIEIERRIINYCDFDNGYSKITIEIISPGQQDYEEHYFRFNNLYFSYLDTKGEGGEITYRHYLNSSGKLIRNLIDDGSGNKNFSEGPYLYELHFAQDILLNHNTK